MKHTKTKQTRSAATQFATTTIAKHVAAQHNPPSKRSDPGGVTTNDERHDFFTHGAESLLGATIFKHRSHPKYVAIQRDSIMKKG